jgi:alcohol dehydrogenase (cytochrome c)
MAGALMATAAASLSQPDLPSPPAPLPAVLRNYQPVTAERLKNPEDGNWLSIRRTYDGWGYSPLDQINADNVKSLRPVWIFSTGETKVHESAPLVNNGVMRAWWIRLPFGAGPASGPGISDPFSLIRCFSS